jgi:hypothetical protein
VDNQADPAALADEAGGADPKVDTSERKSSKGKSDPVKSEPVNSEQSKGEQGKGKQSDTAQSKNSPSAKDSTEDSSGATASDTPMNGGQTKKQNGTPGASAESKPSVFTKQTEKRSNATVPKGLSASDTDNKPDGNGKPSTAATPPARPAEAATPTPPPAQRSVFTPASVTKPHRFPEANGPVNPDSPFKSVSPEMDAPSQQSGAAQPGAAGTQAKDAGPARDNPPVGRGSGASQEDEHSETATLAAAALARELTGAGFASPGFRSTRVSRGDMTRAADAPRAAGSSPSPAGSVFTRATQTPSAPAAASDHPATAVPQSPPTGTPGVGAPASASGQAPPPVASPVGSQESAAASVTNTSWTSPTSAPGRSAPPPPAAPSPASPTVSASPAAPVSDWRPSSAGTQEWTGNLGSADKTPPDTAGLAAPQGPAYSPPPSVPQTGMPGGYGAQTQAAATQAPPTQVPNLNPSTSAAPRSVRSDDLRSKIAMPFAKPGKKKKSRPSAVRKPGGAIGNGRSAVTVKSKAGPVGSPATQLAPKSGVRQDGLAARDAQLVLSRIEPWSVMKFSFLASLVGFVILVIAVAVLYFFFSALGVFHSIEQTIHLVTMSGGNPGSNAASWFSLGTVMGYTMLAGAIDVVLITALSTVAAVIYNAVTHISGGIEITLQEAD